MQKKSVPLRLAQRVYKHLHVRVRVVGGGGGGGHRDNTAAQPLFCASEIPPSILFHKCAMLRTVLND